LLKNEVSLSANGLFALHDHKSRNAHKEQNGGCHLGRFGNRGGVAASHNSLARNIIKSDPIEDETIAIAAGSAIIKPKGCNSKVSV
jgi:hypothetical protein